MRFLFIRRLLAKARRVRAYVRVRTKGHPGPPVMVPEHADRREPARVKPWVMRAPEVTPEQHRASPMVYTGDRPGPKLSEELRRRGWGVMSITGRPPPDMRWAFDNGMFGAARKGEPWSGSDYLNRLWNEKTGIMPRVERGEIWPPDFLVVPDAPILGEATHPLDWQESFFASMLWMARPGLPYEIPWYLAVQNGMTPEHLQEFIDDGSCPIQGIFLGGSDAFKAEEAQRWADFAHENGLAFHYARTSSQRKIDHAFAVGADSMDSAQMLRSGDEWRKTTQAFYRNTAQGPLPLGKARRVRAYVRARRHGQLGLPIVVPEHADIRPAARPRVVVVRVNKQLGMTLHPSQRYGSGSDESNHWKMAVPCPTCGAKIGHGCDMDASEREKGRYWHRERQKAARQAKAIHAATEVLAPQEPPKPEPGQGIHWIKDEEMRAAGFVLGGKGYTGISAHGQYFIGHSHGNGYSLAYLPDDTKKREVIIRDGADLKYARRMAERHAGHVDTGVWGAEHPSPAAEPALSFDAPEPEPAPKWKPGQNVYGKIDWPAPDPVKVQHYQSVPCRCCKAPAGEPCERIRSDMTRGVHAIRASDADAEEAFRLHQPEINTEPDAPPEPAAWVEPEELTMNGESKPAKGAELERRAVAFADHMLRRYQLKNAYGEPLGAALLEMMFRNLGGDWKEAEEVALEFFGGRDLKKGDRSHGEDVAGTARTGKFGQSSRVRSYIEKTVPPHRRHESVLDFGCGPGIHTEKLRREQGFTNVTPHDLPESEKRFPGVRNPHALKKDDYLHAMASKVINTPKEAAGVHGALHDLATHIHPTKGRVVMDFPEPHRGKHNGLDTPTVEGMVRQHFRTVTQVGGSKHEPIWEARHPIRRE